ncbi:MAG: hypothetical protein V3V97_13830 [Hyphomicrobiaceae bacterium]
MADRHRRRGDHTLVDEMVSGRDTLASIEQSIRDVQSAEQRVQGELAEANEERARLLEQRLRAFRELAEVRAKHALADGVIDDADRLSHQVESILQARQKSIAQLREQLRVAEKERQNLLEAHETLANEIADKEARLDELAEQARLALRDEPEYATHGETLAATRAMHEKAREKSQQAEQDRERKGKPYRGDLLFMYLWRRKYGSSGYSPMSLIRWLDEWVADMVGYHDARANYAVLLEIPERLGEHAKRLEERLQNEQDALHAMEAEKIKEIAGHDLTEALRQVREKESEQNGELERLAAEITEDAGQLNRYSAGLDHSFKKAVELSADFLEQESLTQLMRLARDTQEPTDDQIVTHIGQIDHDLNSHNQQIDDRRDELERLFERKEELLRISADFRRTHYDDPGSVFMPEGDLQNLLEELLRGVITGAEYWSRARRRQHWQHRPADPYRRGSHLPPFNGDILAGPGSYRDDGPDFDTGGGF